LKIEKMLVFAFSPKASKSALEQAGLLTYPSFNTFPPQKAVVSR
jgi:hypothetical protein